MNLKVEAVFQIVIHVDYAMIGIFAKCITIFINNSGIIGIFHNPGFP
jgi:hypothetical protein